MPRSLEFKLTPKGKSFSFNINKVDRTKLYGRVELLTFDNFDQKCELATLARDGATVIPYGGTASGYINTDGLWIERDQLDPIDADGNLIEEVETSFGRTNQLTELKSIDEFLDHPIRLTYALNSTDTLPAGVQKKLSGGSIFRFDFSYRGGPDTSPAFILSDESNKIWMLIGETSEIEFIGFEQAAVCASTHQNDSENDDDGFDFDML